MNGIVEAGLIPGLAQGSMEQWTSAEHAWQIADSLFGTMFIVSRVNFNYGLDSIRRVFNSAFWGSILHSFRVINLLSTY
jgi:hypothetical protein